MRITLLTLLVFLRAGYSLLLAGQTRRRSTRATPIYPLTLCPFLS